MGYLTEVVVMNDALHAFEKDPKGFGEAILEGIRRANCNYRQASVPFECYANYISVEPSRHADHEVLFLHAGNCLTVMGAYEKDFKELTQQSPEYAKALIKKAKKIIKEAEQSLKEAEEKKLTPREPTDQERSDYVDDKMASRSLNWPEGSEARSIKIEV